MSCVDVVSTLIFVTEFQDNESFSNLESLIVTLAPKECLLIQGEGSYEFQTLKQVCKKICYSMKYEKYVKNVKKIDYIYFNKKIVMYNIVIFLYYNLYYYIFFS